MIAMLLLAREYGLTPGQAERLTPDQAAMLMEDWAERQRAMCGGRVTTEGDEGTEKRRGKTFESPEAMNAWVAEYFEKRGTGHH